VLMELEEQSICIDCGLCCDGTMFHAIDVDISPHITSDELGPLQARGALLITDKDSRRFLQPCPAFDGSCCDVYEARPATCQTYVCALLESVTQGITELADARSTIERAKELSSLVREALETNAESTMLHLGRPSLSTYLGIMENSYERERLAAAFPEVVELIDLLRSSFGWSNRVDPTDHTVSEK